MACYDSAPLGDGWGWDGQNACQIPADPCTDDDGDGIGVNSLGECKIIVDGCIDDDGDTYGWNGIETCRVYPGNCVDSDGDGYGWNGFRTCLVPGAGDAATDSTSDLLPQAPQAPTPSPESPADPIASSDPVWPVCMVSDDEGPWSVATGSAGDSRECVRTCAADAAQIAQFPGWATDSQGRCLVSSALAGEQAAVPLYAADRLALPETLDSSLLSAGSGNWQCTTEFRLTLDSAFSELGTAGDYLFMADGQLIVRHSDDVVETASWFTAERMLTLNLSEPQHFNAVDFPNGAENRVAHLYSTDLQRLRCEIQTAESTPDEPAPVPVPEPEPAPQPEPEPAPQPEPEPEPAPQPEPEPEPQPEPEPEPQPEPEPAPQPEPEPEPEPGPTPPPVLAPPPAPG
jgi:hypothetical protein